MGAGSDEAADGVAPLRLPERAFPILGAADQPWHDLERVPGDGAHDSG